MDASDSPDVVFVPNLVDSPTFGKIYRSFVRTRTQRRLSSWTCKKTAKPRDLYLFYFGEPEAKVVGLAVCSEPPDPKGWKKRNWTNRRRMFFCSFEALHHFDSPITLADLLAIRALNSWWKTRPYRGRPKTVPPAAAAALLEMIVGREPRTSELLDQYLVDDGIGHKVGMSAPADALEGTIRERLARGAVRSQALREAKIREALNQHRGRLVCEVPRCGFDFLEVYGELGRGFAHVHHRRSLAGRKASRTSLGDLAILCANCHAMVHRRASCRSLQNLIVPKTGSAESTAVSRRK